MKRRVLPVYIVLMASFGFLGPLVRAIGFSSVVCAWLRAWTASISLIIYLLVSKHKIDWNVNKKCIVPMIICGVLLTGDWFGLFSAYKYMTIANATVCYYIAPIIVLLISPLLGEKYTLRHLICSLTAFAGMALTCGVVENGFSGTDFRGPLFSLIGAFSYSGIILINKKNPDGDPIFRTAIQLTVAALSYNPVVFLTEDLSKLVFTPKTIALVIVVGVVLTGIAYVVYFYSIVNLPAKSVAIFSYADPVSSILISAVILKEPMTVYSVIGSVMIIGSAIISELKTYGKSKQKN